MPIPGQRRRDITAIAAIACLLASGCGLRTLRRDLDVSRQQASLEGRVNVASGSSGPVVVVAVDAGDGEVAELYLLARPGPYFMTLPPGTYRIGAFADASRDLKYDPSLEPAATLGATGEIALAAGERRKDANLTIDPTVHARLPFPVRVSGDAHDKVLPALQVGTIASLDDPRFGPEYGDLGLWSPIAFMLEAGGGVYFLEPYDPAKIPILFVHGATGSPANWKTIVASIDRSRFQPWLAYYPAAPHLDRIADQLVRALGSLQVKYRFDRLVLVAHSMGGLVTRSALDDVVGNPSTGRLVQVPLFVSISSPWGGVASARLGVEYAPVVAPMWEDMAPGSAFLTSLPTTPLPPETEYDLLFSYRSDARLSAEANDGTVTVASQLWMPIQRQATHVLGFDETHVSILESPLVVELLGARLSQIAGR